MVCLSFIIPKQPARCACMQCSPEHAYGVPVHVAWKCGHMMLWASHQQSNLKSVMQPVPSHRLGPKTLCKWVCIKHVVTYHQGADHPWQCRPRPLNCPRQSCCHLHLHPSQCHHCPPARGAASAKIEHKLQGSCSQRARYAECAISMQ